MNRTKIRKSAANARRLLAMLETPVRVVVPPLEDTTLKVGDVIERRLIQQFGSELYVSYIVEAVRPDKFLAKKLRPTPSDDGMVMWFSLDMRGQTWR